MAIAFDRAKLRAAVGRYYEQPIARGLIWLHIGPNAVTLLGLALAGVTAYLIAIDQLLWGGVMLLVSGRAGLDRRGGGAHKREGVAGGGAARLGRRPGG